MGITEIDVGKFQALYQRRSGVQLDRDEAFRKLSHLVRQVELVYPAFFTENQGDPPMHEHDNANENQDHERLNSN